MKHLVLPRSKHESHHVKAEASFTLSRAICRPTQALKNQWELEVRKVRGISAGVGILGSMGAVGAERLSSTLNASLAGMASGEGSSASDRLHYRGACMLKAFENAVMKLWPAYCHIDAQRRRAGPHGLGECKPRHLHHARNLSVRHSTWDLTGALGSVPITSE